MAVYQGTVLTVAATGKIQATGVASAGSTIPLMLSGEIPRYVRISATTPVTVRLGKGAQTAIASDLMVQPGDPVVQAVMQGWDNFAVLGSITAGFMQISPLENM